jgi:peptidoglycan biosynthesis protein MviN/MurJ (putative lipid II flippase)
VNVIKVSGAGLLLTVIFNAIFIKIINPPAAGIALSTSLTGLLTCILFFYFLKKKITNLRGISIALFLLKILAISAITGAAVKIVSIYLDRIFGQSIFQQLYFLGISALTGLILFAGLAYIFKIEEVRKFHELIKIRLTGGSKS